MVPERKLDGNFMKDSEIHGESNVRSATQRQKNINRFDVHAGFEGNHRSVGYGFSICWYCHVSRREDGHVLRRTLDFEGERKKGSPERTWMEQIEGEREPREDMKEAG